MAELFEKLSTYFQFSFVYYALITGVVIALCSSLLGVTLVLKRFSFIGDGLSHTAFGAFVKDIPHAYPHTVHARQSPIHVIGCTQRQHILSILLAI